MSGAGVKEWLLTGAAVGQVKAFADNYSIATTRSPALGLKNILNSSQGGD